VVSGGLRDQTGLGDLMAAAGPWEGESTDELRSVSCVKVETLAAAPSRLKTTPFKVSSRRAERAESGEELDR
jgi:hypothetical protein